MADVENGDYQDGSASAIAELIMKRWESEPANPAPEDDEPQDEALEVEAAPAADQEPEISSEAAPEGEAAPVETAPQGVPTPPAPIKAPDPVRAQEAPRASTEPTANQKFLSDLNSRIPLIQAQIATEYPDIKTNDDLRRVALEDPARALRFQIDSTNLQQHVQEQSRASGVERALWEQSERVKLLEAVPELADPAKGPALRDRLTTTAKAMGYTDEQISNASAADVKLLHRVLLAQDKDDAAAAAATAQAKAIEEASKKAAKAPPVQRPGAQRAQAGDEKLKELQERFDRSGDLKDLAKIFAHKGG